MVVSLVTGFLGVKGMLDQRSAEKKAAADRAAVGKLEARQFVNELFLAKAQAIDASIQRQRQATDIESSNIARFSAFGREDRSVAAFLKANRDRVGEDIENIDRQSEQIAAKYATQASVAYKYGQNSAAGMRATSNANFLGNIYKLAQEINPKTIDTVTDFFKKIT